MALVFGVIFRKRTIYNPVSIKVSSLFAKARTIKREQWVI
jgi:hypothetical protein